MVQQHIAIQQQVFLEEVSVVSCVFMAQRLARSPDNRNVRLLKSEDFVRSVKIPR